MALGAEAPPPPNLMIFLLLILYDVQCISDYEIGVSSGFDSVLCTQ